LQLQKKAQENGFSSLYFFTQNFTEVLDKISTNKSEYSALFSNINSFLQTLHITNLSSDDKNKLADYTMSLINMKQDFLGLNNYLLSILQYQDKNIGGFDFGNLNN
jgi:hypothetical protein